MSDRFQSLINRGYSEEEVFNSIQYTADELDFAVKSAFNHISCDCSLVKKPKVFLIGGQPGSGKSSISLNIIKKLKNIVGIHIDNYRMYHPHYLKIESIINKHWYSQNETDNNSKGNDMADFTQKFAGEMADELTVLGMNNNYNLLLEWAMREPDIPLRTIEKLKKHGYNVIIIFVVENQRVSYESCNRRLSFYNKARHIVRKVPKEFHEICIKSLPDSINKIYEIGKKNHFFDSFTIINKNGQIVWQDGYKESAGKTFKKYLEL